MKTIFLYSLTNLNIKNSLVFISMIIVILLSTCMGFFQASIKSIITDNTFRPNYYNSGFNNSSTPHLSPFGGVKYQIITADFRDINYYKHFGRWHNGIDLIPNSLYYKEDIGFKKYKDVVIYATCSGKARSLKDSAGAYYIYLICNNSSLAIFFVHNKYNLIELYSEANVIAGDPIAIMGNTGNSFGAHVHYAIKNTKTNIFLDPKIYMN